MMGRWQSLRADHDQRMWDRYDTSNLVGGERSERGKLRQTGEDVLGVR